MIVVTGASGFIGSAIIWQLNQQGKNDILAVDDLKTDEKWKNLVNLKFIDYLEKQDFLDHLSNNSLLNIKAIIHLGACSSTTEKDASFLIKNNYEYTKHLAKYAVLNGIRFIYASSAATYGDGENGYSDASIDNLEPLNMYGYSKHLFDLWAQNNNISDKIVGLKYFNVFGPNEYHKDDMRSLVNKAFYQIKKTNQLKLFKSYKPEYKDGEQKRDFIYIKDAIKMTLFFLDNSAINGVFNIGTGNAYTWNELAENIFKAMNKSKKIKYVDMPEDLKEKYQYFTQANIGKLRNAGYKEELYSLKAAVTDYVQNYLEKNSYL